MVAEEAKSVFKKGLYRKTAPWPFAIEITNNCPFKCIMCARTKSMTRAVRHMSLEEFKRIIDEFYPHHAGSSIIEKKHIWLHDFGESLTNPQFDEIIKYARNVGFRIGLSINPFMLTNSTSERLLNSGINYLVVALDGHDDESFEKIRGIPKAYTKSVERLEAFLQRRREMNVIDFISLEMVYFKDNRLSYETRKEYWSSHKGIDQFQAKVFTRWDGADESVNSLSDELSEKRSQKTIATCSYPYHSVVVLVDGTVVPCCFDYNAKYPLGNIHEKSIMEICNGEAALALRQEFVTKCVTNSLCAKCERRPGAKPDFYPKVGVSNRRTISAKTG